MRLALTILACAMTTGCVDVYRGAIVHVNLRSIETSADGQHYQLFAVVNGGAVALARFKVLRAIEDCKQDPELVAPLTLVQRYDNGVSRDEVCDFARRMGAVDEVNLAAGSLVGGVRVETAVDLSEAESVFVTREPDGDADPRPDTVLMRAELGPGLSPHKVTARTCLEAFCVDVPESPACAEIPALPRSRRGVILGPLLAVPTQDVCAARVTGEVAVVPAEDETFL